MTTTTIMLLLALGQLPTPTKLLEARRVVVAGERIEGATLEELAQQQSEWGHWQLQADESASDLVVLLTRPAGVPPGTGEPRWTLTIREPAAGPLPLYSDAQSGVYAAGVVTTLVGRLKAVVSGTASAGSPDAAPGVADAVRTVGASDRSPSRPTEPCRMFVTEADVDAAFVTVPTRVRYRKKYYGGSSHAWEGIAREGWKVNADAVVGVNVNVRPSMFSWASPHADGTAVRWTEEGRKHVAKLYGRCFPRPVD